jgi:hypothetical protein
VMSWEVMSWEGDVDPGLTLLGLEFWSRWS